MKTGILLINLGTPSSPTIPAVRRYLRQFLSDPLVVDLPWVLRQLLLYGVILPFRPKKSAHAYQQIWLDEGSPLLVYSSRFTEKLRAVLPFPVTLGMRYGEPSIQAALNSLVAQQCDKIIALSLFPQYSQAASGSALLELKKCLAKLKDQPELEIRDFFYDQPYYLYQLAKSVAKASNEFTPDFILFSYHGVPVRQSKKSLCANDREYRAQCCHTTKAVADLLQLDERRYQSAFQSRLGRTPWIEPYVELELPKLLERGVKRLLVVCPSFVADCLETLEEIGLRLRAQWLALGGDAFSIVPCLNDDQEWVQAVAESIASNL